MQLRILELGSPCENALAALLPSEQPDSGGLLVLAERAGAKEIACSSMQSSGRVSATHHALSKLEHLKILSLTAFVLRGEINNEGPGLVITASPLDPVSPPPGDIPA